MPAVIRGITSGASAITAQPIHASTQDGDTVLFITFRNAAALPGPLTPTFDTQALFTNTTSPGVRLSVTTWNTGEATSYSSTNSNLGYAFITFVGAVTLGTPTTSVGTTGAASTPALTLVDADGSSRVLTALVHRDATAMDTPDGITELAEFAPAANAITQFGVTSGGVTSWPGDASVPVTDGAGVSGWRGISIEIQGPNGQAESGGSNANVTLSTAGAGTAAEQASGGSNRAVAVTTAGAGTAAEHASGGASTTITITTAGGGAAAEATSGGANATVTVTTTGDGVGEEEVGSQDESGGSDAEVTVTTAGAGAAVEVATGGSATNVSVTVTGGGAAAEHASGGSTTTVTTPTSGAGQAAEGATGGATTVVTVTPSGAGAAAEAAEGGSDITVTVTVTGGGEDRGDWHNITVVISLAEQPIRAALGSRRSTAALGDRPSNASLEEQQ